MSHIAIVQMCAATDKHKNLNTILSYVGRAASMGCDIVAFPEYMMFYVASRTPREVAADAESINGEFVSAISQAAKSHRIHIIGTMYEKSRRADRVYDTAFHLDGSGMLVESYRKTHLYDALGTSESRILVRGSRIARPQKTPVGRTGMLICYDLRFPEVSRTLASAGSEILVAPSAWVRGPGKEDQWITINKARAIENGCYVIAPDHVGNAYCGRSLAVDPSGKILLDMKKRRGIARVCVSTSTVRAIRRRMPLLAARRTDMYPRL